MLVRRVAIADDGSILVGGSIQAGGGSGEYYPTLSRFNPTGQPDPSFGDEGTVISPPAEDYWSETRGSMIQDDGKIVLVAGGVYPEGFRVGLPGGLTSVDQRSPRAARRPLVDRTPPVLLGAVELFNSRCAGGLARPPGQGHRGLQVGRIPGPAVRLRDQRSQVGSGLLQALLPWHALVPRPDRGHRHDKGHAVPKADPVQSREASTRRLSQAPAPLTVPSAWVAGYGMLASEFYELRR
jgi:hypothetical protein